jgi:hypothetical protein
MKRALAFLAFAGLLSAGCSSGRPYASIRPEVSRPASPMSGLERDALLLLARPNGSNSAPLLLSLAESALAEPSLARSSKKSALWARFVALSFSGRSNDTASVLKELTSLDPRDGRTVWAEAVQERDDAKRRKILTKSRVAGANPFFPTLLSAIVAEDAGDFPAAAALWDETLTAMPEDIAAAFRPRRDAAFARAKTGGNASETAWMTSPAITVTELIQSLSGEGLLPASLAASGAADPSNALSALERDGTLPESLKNPAAILYRSDAAWFLRSLMLKKGKKGCDDASVRGRFPVSPVPDVPADSPYFGAIVACVEAGCMELADGVRFDPGGKVSGKEWAEMLSVIKKW